MHEHKLNHAHIMTEVYSYPFPEVRELLSNQQLDPSFMINTIDVDEARSLLSSYAFDPALDLPTNETNELDLDSIHNPVIERIRAVQLDHLPGLDSFEHTYPMPGSSQSMYTLMAEWSAKGTMFSMAVRAGEYEGYRAYAESLGIPVYEYDSFAGHDPEAGQVWFVSNPNALDGNKILDDEWDEFVAAGHDIVLDAAYVGLTTEMQTIDVSADNIRAVLTSPSKLFGVFRYRNTGVTYTREPIDAMYGSRWFKDVPALLASLSLYETFGHNELPQKYASTQAKLCGALSVELGVQVVPSDVLLLAHTKQDAPQCLEPYRRGSGYRFGLTKLFEDAERGDIMQETGEV